MLKAVLHKAKRQSKAADIDKTYLTVKEVKELYRNKEDKRSLTCLLAVLTSARINSIVNCKFRIKNHNKVSFQIQFTTTKTVAHNILVSNKFKKLFKKYISISEKITYSEILSFCKYNYSSGTHILRRSAAYILEASKQFSSDDIRLYGNWAMSKNCLTTNYLRDSTYQRISQFWEGAILE